VEVDGYRAMLPIPERMRGDELFVTGDHFHLIENLTKLSIMNLLFVHISKRFTLE
jgi:hypothetical protein